jgi:hypothetical protein
MNQIALPFAWPAADDERDFIISDSNRVAIRHLEHWSLWPVMATVLIGPRKSGRSLIGRIFAAKSGGRFIDAAEKQDEEMLFHAWNAAQENRSPLLMIADVAPPHWRLRLPDLRSRLLATPLIVFAEPDADLTGPLIEKLLTARGVYAPPEVVRYLVPRVERSYIGIGRVVDAIDEIALEKRQRITVPIARSALAMVGVIDDPQYSD